MINGISKVLIINHISLKDRLEFQKEQCNQYDLSYEIIEAIDIDNSLGFTNKQIKSCFLSHIKALEIASSIDGNCLILEDDSAISDIDGINNFMSSIIDNNIKWDMLYMYPSGYPGNNPVTINSHIIKNTKTLNAHAYIVNPILLTSMISELNEYVKKMERLMNKQSIKSHYDHVLTNSFHPNMNIYSPHNYLIFQYRKKFGSCLGWGLVTSEGVTYPTIID